MPPRELFLGFLCCCLPAQEPMTSELDEATAWLETHLPDPGRKAFGRIAIEGRIEHGFLLSSTAERFSVLTIDAEQIDAELRGVTWREESLDEFVRERLQTWQGDPKQFGIRRSIRPVPSHATSFLVLAWACRRNGMPARAMDLTTAAKSLYGDRTKTLVAQLGDDMARTELWRLMLSFADPELSWQELRDRHRRAADRFAGARIAPVLTRFASLLARMIREETERGAAAGDPTQALSELVFRLREQRGGAIGEPPRFDVFADPRGDASPAARLAAAGHDAIPHLLPLLDSGTLTRCVWFHRQEQFSHRILPVGEVAREVWFRILGHRPRGRVDAERWWSDYRTRGAAAVYADGAIAGDAEQARRLLALDPGMTLATVCGALEALPANRHAPLLEVLNGVPDEQVTHLLRIHLRESTAGPARLAAAAGLCLRGEIDEAIAGLIETLRSTDPRLSFALVARFLAGTGRRDALAALFAEPGRLDDTTFAQLASDTPFSLSAMRPDGSGVIVEWTRPDPEQGWANQLERHLGEVLMESPYSLQIKAADVLVRRWPEVYAFDASAPMPEQRKALDAMRTSWRRRQGLPEEPGGRR